MEFAIDLRYFFTPLINLVLLLFTSQGQGGTPFPPVLASNQFNDEYPILKFASFVLVIILLLLFLLTSLELHLNARPKITVKVGCFSGPLAFSLLASMFLPPPLFWAAHFSIIITFPWHGMIWDLLERFFKWFLLTLESIPTFSISCTQQEDFSEATPFSSPGFGVEFVDIEGNIMLNLPSME